MGNGFNRHKTITRDSLNVGNCCYLYLFIPSILRVSPHGGGDVSRVAEHGGLTVQMSWLGPFLLHSCSNSDILNILQVNGFVCMLYTCWIAKDTNKACRG